MTTWEEMMTFVFMSNGVIPVNREYTKREKMITIISLSNGIVHVNRTFQCKLEVFIECNIFRKTFGLSLKKVYI